MDTENTPPSQVKEVKEVKEVKLVDIPVTNENEALNMMVNFLTLAHKRGAYTIDETAKIWECIKMFQKDI
jgi:hypothetical protein